VINRPIMPKDLPIGSGAPADAVAAS
jgi:hypothetical protein